ncbi:hypothetical protein H8S20_14635 [Clostridium sp. NSJ-6]|uniref:Cxxc_20_cxxc protein n=1 Tax=Clostridium hominis TaxID=2763036 RepID=A0ABR7DFC8_9CLOT|nr:hypothetical protein [Clostridium hominis]MBC5630105.1 hypothetical protein [Clostridium hominis]
MINKTCPHCNYKFSTKDIFLRKYSQFINCPKCKTKLVASIKSKFIFSIIMLFTFIAWAVIVNSSNINIGSWAKYLLAFILFFILFFIIEPLTYKFEISKDLSKSKR